MYYICEITDEEDAKTVEVIPSSWYISSLKSCAWPPIKNVSSLVRASKLPENHWSLYSARILHNYASLAEARQHLSKAQYTSDLSSDVEDIGTPKRRPQRDPKQLFYGEVSEEEPHTKNQPRLKRPLPKPPAIHEASIPKRSRSSDLDFPLAGGSSLALENSVLPTLGLLNQGLSTDTVTAEIEMSRNEIIIEYSGLGEAPGSTAAVVVEKDNENNSTHNMQCSGNENSKVLAILMKMSSDIILIKQSLQNLDRKVDSLMSSKSTVPTQEFIQQVKSLPLPFTTVQGLDTFQSGVTEDQLKALDVSIKSCGGDSTVEFVGRAMRKMISDELAVNYSLLGFRGNIKFMNTCLWSVLKDALLSIKGLNADEKKIENAVSEWFRHANERLKKKREKELEM